MLNPFFSKEVYAYSCVYLEICCRWLKVYNVYMCNFWFCQVGFLNDDDTIFRYFIITQILQKLIYLHLSTDCNKFPTEHSSTCDSRTDLNYILNIIT